MFVVSLGEGRLVILHFHNIPIRLPFTGSQFSLLFSFGFFVFSFDNYKLNENSKMFIFNNINPRVQKK